MAQSEIFMPSWSFDEAGYSVSERVDDCGFSPLFGAVDGYFGFSSEPFSPLIFGESTQMSLEEFGSLSGCEFGSFYPCLDESVGNFPSPDNDQWSPLSSQSLRSDSTATVTQNLRLILPRQDTEIENELGLRHLLTAYGEALENGHKELEEVILFRVGERASPLGKPLERVGFALARELAGIECDQYLQRESVKNYSAAFDAVTRILPFQKFAHFTANTAILEALPEDAETIHVVDFDIGEGLQWPQIISAASRLRRLRRLKLTSVKWESDQTGASTFATTSRLLAEHARSYGVKLIIEEMGMEDLVRELKRGKKNGKDGEFSAFNSMIGLPHMMKPRSRKLVTEFLSIAKDSLCDSAGILLVGDADPCEKLTETSPSFSAFFDGHVLHYAALLEATELGFPAHLVQARTAVECLFVAPFVSSRVWADAWDSAHGSGPRSVGFEGVGLSEASVAEAREIVGGEGGYGVRVEGVNGNEAALEWNGVSLVRVSAWKAPR